MGVGEAVTFTAVIKVPPNAGKVVAAQWDFEGDSTFAVEGKLIPDGKNTFRVTLKTTHTFTKPGTYFITLRVASQREGDPKTPFTRIQNLERVRVVVK